MIFFLILSFSHKSTPEFALFRRRAMNKLENPLKANDNQDPIWYFAKCPVLPTKPELTAKGIEIKPGNTIGGGWYNIFLSREQATFLNQKGCQLQSVHPEEKLLLRENVLLKDCDFLIIETHESFVEPEIKGLDFYRTSPTTYNVHCQDKEAAIKY